MSVVKPSFFLRFSLIIGLISFFPACSGSNFLERSFAPDPDLQSSPTPSVSPNSTPTEAQLPPDIPRYPDAKLLKIESGSNDSQGSSRWSSSDPVNLIETFYLRELQAKNWEIVEPFASDQQGSENRLIARRNDLELTVSLTPNQNNTEFTLDYQNATAATSPETNSEPSSLKPTTFTDFAQVPQPLEQYVEDLAQLGVLTPKPDNSEQFSPNQTINRREYARWLFSAYNAMYANTPEKQIRQSYGNSQPIFSDIPASDPDFDIIQGLAEAGFISSSLLGETSSNLFRPDAPVTREDLVTWKVVLDLRKVLPTATIDNVKETWGFQDTAKIDPKAIRALYADFQNGDKANVRRVFGYTTLFQPKKTVTRAEAAAALWYFGFQGEGISATEALQQQNATNSANSNP